ncbi:MAG: Ig-like domain-containing protein [Zoogloea sp.]|uniref:Ig-like domain-containing protein n=1 Tax=Zoogloea sp. TaxID=49181 RepID=UPI003F32EB88
MQQQKMKTGWKLLAGLFAGTALVLTGCGGGGGGGSSTCTTFPNCSSSGGGTSNGGTTSTATQLSLIVSSATLQTDGSSTVTVTATLKNSANAVVSGQAVQFSATSGTLSAASSTTSSAGTATVTFNSNDNKVNRTVTITATSGTLTKTVQIAVQGTSLGFGGDISAVVGSSASMSVNVLDGASKAVANQEVTLTSAKGNPVPATATTNSAGVATFSFTPTMPGTDTITASALGASLSQSLLVSAMNFTITSPAANVNYVGVNNCQSVTAFLASGTTTNVKFATSRGSIYASSAACAGGGGGSSVDVTPTNTGSTSTALAYVRSSTVGDTQVTATATDSGGVTGSAKRTLTFVSTTPSQMQVQSSSSVLAVNGSASVTALVRDASGNPVYNQTVVFSAPNGGGSPSPMTATTNASGVATTTFTADSTTSGFTAVVVHAELQSNAAIYANSSLTVAGQAANTLLGTDGLIVILSNPIKYRQVWTAVVSDTAGNPIANQQVSAAIRGVTFGKGVYEVRSAKWTRVPTVFCPAEDANNNWVVDSGEIGDVDLDGVLEPNGAATVHIPDGSISVATTDSAGNATFHIDYLPSYAGWTYVELRVSAVVSGSNMVASRVFLLDVPVSVTSDTAAAPAFQLSPFGATGTVCSDPN